MFQSVVSCVAMIDGLWWPLVCAQMILYNDWWVTSVEQGADREGSVN